MTIVPTAGRTHGWRWVGTGNNADGAEEDEVFVTPSDFADPD
jgi:hypothetical protein